MPRFVIIFLVFLCIVILVTIIVFVFFPPRSNERPVSQPTVQEPAGAGALMASDDGGGTWQELMGSAGLTVLSFAFKQNQSSTFYVGTKGQGLWIAEDSGSTFTQVKDTSGALDQNADVYAIAQSAKGDILYLAVYERNVGRVVKLEADHATVVYTAPIQGYGIFGVLVSPTNDQHLFVAVGDGSFLESTDGGTSWEVISRTRQGIVNLIADPRNPQKFWALGNANALYTSESAGRVWVERTRLKIDNKKTAKKVNALFFDQNRAALLAATDYALIESKDDGVSWQAFVSPIPPATLEITAAAGHPRFSEVLWIAAQNKIYRTDDGGITWRESILPVQKNVILLEVDSKNPKRVYAGLSK